MTKRKKILLWSVVGVVLTTALLIGLWAVDMWYRLEICNYESYDGQGHGYYVYPDMDADSLLHRMQQDYEVFSLRDWRWHKKHLLYTNPKPGYYHFPARIGDKHLIRRVQAGIESPVRITWTNQVRTRNQLAGVLAKQLLLDSTTIVAHLDSTPYLQQYALNKETAVCMFLPNTYEVYWTMTTDDLFKRMKREYDYFWNESRQHKADSLHLTREEVATLASIVESETNRRAEYPQIAGLYLNRLRKGMHLQACPTVIFAVGNFRLRRVLQRHLQIDSPYNTYKNLGLPPGPIRCAMGTTIDDVLNAPPTKILFMCANPDFSGTHIFSTSYSQHSSVAHQYQSALDERLLNERIEKERAEKEQLEKEKQEAINNSRDEKV